MAKKARKNKTKKTKTKAKKSVRKAKAKKTKKNKPKRKTVGQKISGAYRVVVDTVKGTDKLRNRLEPPGTSETE
ncbi:MAG: hypothetical protein ABI830_07375 [Pseudolabrys sp.]